MVVVASRVSAVSLPPAKVCYPSSPRQQEVPFTPRPRRNSWTSGQVVTSEATLVSGLVTTAKRATFDAGAKPVPARPHGTNVAATSQTLRPLQRHEISQMPIKFIAGAGKGRPGRVVCYGDSLTAGFCSSGTQFEPYGRTLAKELEASGFPCEVVVSGHSGKTAQEMVAAMNTSLVDVVDVRGKGLARILEENATTDLVIIMTGTNDMGKGSSMEAIAKDIALLHAACHRRGVETVAVVPPPAPCTPPQREHDRMRLRKLMEEWAAGEPRVQAVVDPAQWVPLNGGESVWDNDGLHFCPRGSALLGQRLAVQIAKMISDAEGMMNRVSNLRTKSTSETKLGVMGVASASASSPTPVLSPRQILFNKPGCILKCAPKVRAGRTPVPIVPLGRVAIACA